MDPLSPHIFTSPENEKQSKGIRGVFHNLPRLTNGKKAPTALGPLVLVAFLLSTGFFLKNLENNQAPERSQAQVSLFPKQLRIMEIAYYPRGAASIGTTVPYPECTNNPRGSTFTGYHPDCIYAASEYDIEQGSRYKGVESPVLDFVKVVPRIDQIGHSPKVVGGTGPDWYESLKKMFFDNNVCQTIEQNNIDQVWFYKDVGFDNGGFDKEYFVSWPSPQGEGDDALPQLCPGSQRVISVISSDVNFGPSLASYGHFVENILSTTQGAELFWQRFSGHIYSGVGLSQLLPLYELCGNDHFPPTSPSEDNPYEYTYPGTPATNNLCNDWHPDLSGTRSTVTCADWSCDRRKYFVWWLQRMPGANNSLRFNELNLPAWHAFFADTANTISQYYREGKWLSPNALAKIGSAPANSETAWIAADSTSTTTAWTNPTSTTTNFVLGASTDSGVSNNSLGSEGQVLQASTGYGNVVLVTAAYKPRTNPNAKINSLTYCGQPMTYINRAVNFTGPQVTELWYMKSPPGGSCQVRATFSANPEERVFSSTIIKNVDLAAPLVQNVGSTGGYSGESSGSIVRSNDEAYDSLLTCVYSTYPEGQNNIIKALNPRENLWSYRGKNIATGLGMAVKRMATETGKTSWLTWESTYAMPSAYGCVIFKLNPASAVQSTATAIELRLGTNYNTDNRRGIQKTFYNNPDFTSLVKTIEDNTDAAVNTNWLTNSPYPGEMDPDTFSVRWNGYITPIFSGEHTIYARANDGVRVWIDDQLIIDRWSNYLSAGAGPLNSGKVNMQLGKRYKIRIDYYENTGDASFSLYWSHANYDMRLVSRIDNLYLASGSLATPTPATPTPVPPVTPKPTPTVTPTPTPTAIPSVVGQLMAQYFDNQDFTNLKYTRFEPYVNKNWGTASPITGVGGDTFSVRWTGYLRAPVTGTYTFTTKSDGGIKFMINNQLLIDDSVAHTTLKESLPKTINLELGKLYPIQVDYFETTGNAYAQLLWTYPTHLTKTAVEAGVFFHEVPAGSATDLNMELYDNADLTNLKAVRYADIINNNWGTGAPTGVGADTFSIRYTGYLKAPVTGTYTIYTKSDSGMRFWIGDTKKAIPDINDWTLHNTVTEKSMTISLVQNQLYPIKAEFFEDTGNAFAQLLWSYPGQSKIGVPGTRLFH
jgi:hypothetical protein